MHLNYYFLKLLTPKLNKVLSGSTLAEAFSQSKDELVATFLTSANDTFTIRATLTSSFSCLSFPDEFRRSRRNSANLFEPLYNLKVRSLRQFENERAFAIEFESDKSLIFKLHGNRSNILLVHDNQIIELFKSKLTKDKELNIELLDRNIDQSYEAFQQDPRIQTVFPTYGKVAKSYLDECNFSNLKIEDQWKLLSGTHEALNHGHFFICTGQDKPVFSLLNLNDHCQRLSDDPIEAINAFYRHFTKVYFLDVNKSELKILMTKREQQLTRYITKSQSKLRDLNKGAQPKEIADILMANIHAIQAGSSEVTLHNFYANSDITIRLNKNLSPQKNAENYYRKGKNRVIEEDTLKNSISAKQSELIQTQDILNAITACQDMKELKKLIKAYALEKEDRSNLPALPYKEFTINGFRVWVGKNAKSNDELSLKYRFKEDIWLHAKDVSGSHVLIKHQSGKPIDTETLTRVAEIAAFYSKRKTDSLAPVIYTPAKYIRKPKGSPPGSVVVEKEKVLLVKPKAPDR